MALALQPSPQTLSPQPPTAHRSPSRAEPTLMGLTPTQNGFCWPTSPGYRNVANSIARLGASQTQKRSPAGCSESARSRSLVTTVEMLVPTRLQVFGSLADVSSELPL